MHTQFVILIQLIKSWRVWGSAAKAPKLPENYEKEFKMADLTFLHHWVYDSSTASCVNLNPIPEDVVLDDQLLQYIGKQLDQDLVRGIAHGEINPITLKKFESRDTTLTWLNSKESSIHKVLSKDGNSQKITQARISLKPTMPLVVQNKRNVKITQIPIKNSTTQIPINSSEISRENWKINLPIPNQNNTLNILESDKTLTVSGLLGKHTATRPHSVLIKPKRKLPEEQQRLKFKATRLTDFWKHVPKRDTVSPYFKPKESS